jgi:hypothetical protein
MILWAIVDKNNRIWMVRKTKQENIYETRRAARIARKKLIRCNPDKGKNDFKVIKVFIRSV